MTFIAPDIFTTRINLFLKPGHSHNASDVITGECGRLLLNKNVYTVEDMAKVMNGSKNVIVSVLEGDKFFQWDHFLNKHFKDMPQGFTKFYYFEFEDGKVEMSKLANLELERPEEDTEERDLVRN